MIEAISYGTPVIAWRCGSVPEVMEDGVNGFVVETVAEAVASVGRLGGIDRDVVRATFERRFTADVMAANYLTLYREVILADVVRTAPAPRASEPAS